MHGLVALLCSPPTLPFGFLLVGLGAAVMFAPIGLAMLGFWLVAQAERAVLCVRAGPPGRATPAVACAAPDREERRAAGPGGGCHAARWAPGHVRRPDGPRPRPVLLGVAELSAALGVPAESLAPVLRAAERGGLARLWDGGPDGPLVVLPGETTARLGLVRVPGGGWRALGHPAAFGGAA
jgi:hypothetical protein